MEVEKLYDEIQCLCNSISINNVTMRESLIENGMKVLMQYKKEDGIQKIAYNTLLPLHNIYKEDELKQDLVDDILDYVCGWSRHEQYPLWDTYYHE